MKYLSLFILIFLLVSCRRSSEKIFFDKRDKNQYQYIEAGNNTWMANDLVFLNSDIYNKGAWIWNCKEEKFEDIKCRIFSEKCVLYNWETANYCCPDGWHLSSVDEWKELMQYYLADKHGSTDLSELNLSFDGHARMFNKFCIFDGNTYWTCDTSESNQMAVAIAIQHSKDGGIIYKNEVTGIDNAFYVRCIKDRE